MVGDGDGEMSQTQINSTRFKSWKNKGKPKTINNQFIIFWSNIKIKIIFIGKDAESSRKQRQENAIELRKNKREGTFWISMDSYRTFGLIRGFFGDEIIGFWKCNLDSDFWLLEALTKKRNVPTLDGDDLDTDSDPGSVRPNLLELVTNARSENPQTQLDAIQCKNYFL